MYLFKADSYAYLFHYGWDKDDEGLIDSVNVGPLVFTAMTKRNFDFLYDYLSRMPRVEEGNFSASMTSVDSFYLWRRENRCDSAA